MEEGKVFFDDEKLIELVRQHNALYDSRHPFYGDAWRRTQKWKEIAAVLNQDAEKCKIRWESLRNQFRKYMRKKISKGESADSFASWKYYDNLSFLLPHMKNKTITGSIPTEEDPLFISPVDADEENSSEISQDLEVQTGPIRAKRKAPTKVETVGNTSKKYILNDENEETKIIETVQVFDDLDLFFDTMKATVRKFSEPNKILAKQKVFNVVTDLEAINFTQQSKNEYEN